MTIHDLQDHLELINSGQGKICPGEEFYVSPAAGPGDAVWQGDLKLVLLSQIPAGFRRIENPTDIDRQLVPGNTTGSRHCVEDLATCEIYLPDGFSRDASYDGWQGPVLLCREETRITHSVGGHGDVIFPGDRIVGCEYQRVYDEELKRARRAID
jgi:hypothetical protein